MKRRSCQDCTACCEGWLSSKTIDMSPGKPCRHCESGGCAIYETRPQNPCRSFECEWVRAGSELAEELRPDRCGAIVLHDRKFHGWTVLIATPTGWKIPPVTLRRLKDYAHRQNTPLIYIENFHRDGRYTHFSRSGFGPKPFIETIEAHYGDTDPVEM